MSLMLSTGADSMTKRFAFSLLASALLFWGGMSALANAAQPAEIAAEEARLEEVGALIARALKQEEAGDDDAAIELYAQIRQRFDQDASPRVRVRVAEALFYEAKAYERQEQTPFEMAVYERIEERFGQDKAPDIQLWVARALHERAVAKISMSLSGTAMSETGVLAAMTLFAQLDSRFGQAATTPDMQAVLASARLESARAYGLLGEHEMAIKRCDELAARYGKHETPAIRTLLAAALLFKGESLANLENPQAALQVYKQLEKIFGKDNDPEIQAIRAEARNAQRALRQSF
jgi:tetratricopeptide (TPR) repeat protein